MLLFVGGECYVSRLRIASDARGRWLIVAGHGAQKLFGWFGGNGIKGAAKMLESLNIHPPMTWAYTNGIAEFGGGWLIALGLLLPSHYSCSPRCSSLCPGRSCRCERNESRH